MVVLRRIDEYALQTEIMKKPLLQGIVTVSFFLAAWFSLSQINWMGIFKVQQVSEKTEQKLGDFFWKIFKQQDKEITDAPVVNAVDSIITNICNANGISRDKLKVHILEKDEINAFALPNAHLIIYSGLILNAENQEELAGVVCHEIAHIQLNHVMKKLVKEMGLSVLLSATTGNGEVTRKAAKILSSSAFDRSLEKEADITAVDYLEQANVDPRPLADFLYKLADGEPEATKYLTWMSTHPDLKERAEYIIAHSKGDVAGYKPVLTDETWEKVKAILRY